MSQPTKWLNEFINQVTDSLTMLNEPVEFACHVFHNETPGSNE